jgi:hypothetical protein
MERDARAELSRELDDLALPNPTLPAHRQRLAAPLTSGRPTAHDHICWLAPPTDPVVATPPLPGWSLRPIWDRVTIGSTTRRGHVQMDSGSRGFLLRDRAPVHARPAKDYEKEM